MAMANGSCTISLLYFVIKIYFFEKAHESRNIGWRSYGISKCCYRWPKMLPANCLEGATFNENVSYWEGCPITIWTSWRRLAFHEILMGDISMPQSDTIQQNFIVSFDVRGSDPCSCGFPYFLKFWAALRPDFVSSDFKFIFNDWEIIFEVDGDMLWWSRWNIFGFLVSLFISSNFNMTWDPTKLNIDVF